MTKSDLQKLIRQEVTSVVRSELQKIVKPLVQEAVAGALGGLLAEGIVKGPPAPQKREILTPNVPQARSQASPGGRQAASGRNIDPSVRRRMAEQLGYGQIDRVSAPRGFMGDGVVGDILTETAMEMAGHSGPHVDSVLDAADSLDGAVAPEVVDAITRDYSGLMAAMNRRGKING
jgi:hypothetical protein